jgi:hypothetical protein
VSLSPLEGENHIGSASMHTTASNNLVLTSFSSYKRLAEFEKRISHAGLYQGIAQNLIRGLNTNQAIAEFAARLVSVADHAHLIRRFDIVGHVGQLLLGLPLARQLEGLGDYYHAVSLNRASLGDTVRAGYLFERVGESASLQYRAKAMLALGTNSLAAGDPRTANSFYHEVIRVGMHDQVFDPVTCYFARQMSAVTKAMDGDHRGSLADLEGIYPLVRMASSVQPYTYYDYLNALAVELAEAGVLERARRVSGITLSSCFAFAYPNWRETFEEIEAKLRRSSRSIVGVRQPISETDRVRQPVRRTKTDNVLQLPAAERSATDGLPHRRPRAAQASVTNLQEWKTTFKRLSTPLPDKLSPEEIKRMTTGQKLIRLMDLVSRDETDDEMINNILESVEQIVLNRRGEKLD